MKRAWNWRRTRSTKSALHNRFALAITPGGALLPLPAPVSAGG